MVKCGETVSGDNKRQTNSRHKVITELSDTVVRAWERCVCDPSHRVCKSLCYALFPLVFLRVRLYKAFIALYISPLDSSNDEAAYQNDGTRNQS